jgi:hypothetical protein
VNGLILYYSNDDGATWSNRFEEMSNAVGFPTLGFRFAMSVFTLNGILYVLWTSQYDGISRVIRYDGVTWSLVGGSGSGSDIGFGILNSPTDLHVASDSKIWVFGRDSASKNHVSFWNGSFWANQFVESFTSSSFAGGGYTLVGVDDQLLFAVNVHPLEGQRYETTDGSTWGVPTWPDANTLTTVGTYVVPSSTTPPRLEDVKPEPGETGVTNTTPIGFKIVDDEFVVLSTVQIFVGTDEDRTLVYDGSIDSFADGWGNSFKDGSGAAGYTFRLIPDSYWLEGQTVVVTVIASNLAALQLAAAYSFTIESAVEFPFESYKFLIEAVRNQDRKSPGIIKPFMDMIDERWKTRIFDRATEAFLTLRDPLAIDSRWLPFLLAQVGFSRDLSFDATEDEVRKMIADGARYFSHKPTELAVEDSIRMVTGNRFRIGNFFDFRLQVDWTHVLELLEDFDPYVLDFGSDNDVIHGDRARSSVSAPAGYPGDHYVVIADPIAPFTSKTQYQYFVWKSHPTKPENVGIYEIEECLVGTAVLITKKKIPSRTGFNYGPWSLYSGMSEFRTEVRIVDDPNGPLPVNRALLRFLINLIRPSNERYDIIYISFLDQFLSPSDLDQWTLTGNVTVPEPGGEMVVPAGAEAQCAASNRFDWGDQSTFFKVWGDSSGAVAELQFWYHDSDNYFWAELDFDAHTVKLYRRIGAATAQIGSTVTMPSVIVSDRFIGVRIDALAEGSGVRIRVKVNGETQIDQNSAAPVVNDGGPGIKATGNTVRLALSEVMSVPATIDRAGPNP